MELEYKDQKIPFSIQTSNKRKTVSISVYNNGEVRLKVPKNYKKSQIIEIIENKKRWIINKIQHFKDNPTHICPKKKYISGEEFFYLGKQYSLEILYSTHNKILLSHDNLNLYQNSRSKAKNILEKWYLEKAQQVFNERLDLCYKKFSLMYSYPKPNLILRRMKSRWGSMSNFGNMTLNTHLIFTDIELIDYVITHELCHLKHSNHSKRFYNLQSKFTPDFQEKKQKLQKFIPFIKAL